MVQTRRSAAILGNASDQTKSAQSLPLPPRNSNRATTIGQQSQLPSLPTSILTATATNKDVRNCRRKSTSRRKSGLHERPPRDNASQINVPVPAPPCAKTAAESRKGEESPSANQLPKVTTGENIRSLSKRNNRADTTNKENREHFLRGINLKNCQDILSIPSPPTPLFGVQALVSKIDPNRRSSLCHVPSPLEGGQLGELKKPNPEMKNPQHLFLDGFNEQAHMAFKRSKERTKRRQTLLVQPNIKNTLARPPPQNGQKKDWIVGGLDEDEEEEYQLQNTKPSKKRRQSLLLPSECSESHGIPAEELSKAIKEDKFRVVEGELPISQRQMPKLIELQKLVRGYCCSETDSKQRKKEFAIRIKHQTGYSLSQGDSVEEAVAVDQEVIRSKRSILLVKIGPSVQEMEEKKGEQAKEAEILTGCCYEKTKSGRYKYREISSSSAKGQRVPSEEYKKRYAAMIAKKKQEKAKTFEVLMPTQEMGVTRTSTSPKHDNDDMDCDDTDVLFEHVTPQSHDGATDTCRGKGGPLHLHLHLQTQEENVKAGQEAFLTQDADNHINPDSGANPNNGMTLHPESNSGNHVTDLHDPDTSVQKASLEFAEEAFLGEDATNCIDSELNQGMTLDPDSSIGDYITGQEPYTMQGGKRDSTNCIDSELNQGMTLAPDTTIIACVRTPGIEEPGCKESEPPESTLPMPSREDESDDPEIAAAESKLWRAIDTALETYSREVMAIQEKKRRRC